MRMSEDLFLARKDTFPILYADFDTEVGAQGVTAAVEVIIQHCTEHLEIIPMRLMGDSPQLNRSVVKLLI